jgi:hypothetical protein
LDRINKINRIGGRRILDRRNMKDMKEGREILDGERQGTLKDRITKLLRKAAPAEGSSCGGQLLRRAVIKLTGFFLGREGGEEF